MSEIERKNDRQGWIGNVDHEAACAAVVAMTFDTGDVNDAMAAIIREQQDTDRASYRDLTKLGSHMIPLDHTGRISDDTTKFEVFMVGMNLALVTLDTLCDQFYIDIDEFRRDWRAHGVSMVLDLNDKRVQAMTPQEQYESVAQGIMEFGHQALAELEDTYDPLLDAMGDWYPSVSANPGTAKAAFGYILGGGLRRLNTLVEERELQQLLNEAYGDDPSEDTAASKPLEALPRYRTLDHVEVADQLDTAFFFAGLEPEVYMGELAQKLNKADEYSMQVHLALAAVAQPNIHSTSVPDKSEEAFRRGSVLAHEVVLRHARECGIDETSVSKIWRSQPAHVKARKIDSPIDESAAEVSEHIVRILDKADLTDAYDSLLLKVADESNYEAEESVAVANGFHYMLITGTDALNVAVNRAIAKQASSEMEDFEDELIRLLGS